MTDQQFRDHLVKRGPQMAVPQWAQSRPGDRLPIAGLDLSGEDLHGLDLARADARGTKFHGANMSDVILRGAILVGAEFQATNGQRPAGLARADLEGADLTSACLRGCDLTRVNLSGATLTRADLGGADVSLTTWGDANLTFAKLRGVRVDQPTAFPDQTERIRFGRFDRWLRWRWVRFLSDLPIFGFSYGGLIGALAIGNTVHWLNETRFVQDLNYPIEVPPRTLMLLVASLCLALGATVYRVRCPARVREFSETKWVEEMQMPRILWVATDQERRVAQAIAAMLTLVGGAATLGLLIERVWRVFT